MFAPRLSFPLVNRFLQVTTAAAAFGLFCLAPGAGAQVNITEPPDLNGQDLGTIGLGDNTVTGALSTSLVSGGGFPAQAGDESDQFSFTIPAGMFVTALEMTITNYAGNGALAIYPGVQIVGVSYLPATATSGANALTIPAPGRLAPGSYTFSVLSGLSVATNNIGNNRSFNYLLRIRAEADAGACCNRWTGSCGVLTAAACASVGLRFDGFGSACSPATCGACPADFNASGATSVQDIFDFLAAYFAGCS